MKITSVSSQSRDPNRVNVSVDGAYRFSLDIFQIGELGVKVGREYTDEELTALETESQFGKIYARALEYCLMRPHSAKEVRDYLWRKTRASKYKNRKTGELQERAGVSQEVADRVYDRLLEKGYIDDERFARFWIENRNVSKGASRRKLMAELRAKGVDAAIVERLQSESSRNEEDELQKVIAKKRSRYDDEQKFTQYLMRQGFRYGDIRDALKSDLTTD